MSRKSIILCLSLLIVLLLGLGVAIAILYSGTGGSERDGRGYSFDGSRQCLSAVPSDAVLVSSFASAGSACRGILSGFEFPSQLSQKIEDESLASLKRCPMAASLHYAGKLHSLYIADLDRATDATASGLEAYLAEIGMHYIKAGSLIAISSSEPLVKASARHFEKNVSIADAPGFESALSSVSGEDIVLVSNMYAGKLIPAIMASGASRMSSFVERAADWMAFDVTSRSDVPVSLIGTMLYEGEPDEFLTVLEGCRPGVSEVAEVLPSYVSSVVTLPVKGVEEYITAYQSFIDSRQALQGFKARQKSLGESAGIMPEDLFRLLDIKELASAAFVVNSKLEHINLICVGSKDAALIFKGNEVASVKDAPSQIYSWAYPSFMASVFGKRFELADETCFTYVDGWIITGSRDAINEYVEKGALDYTLEEYMSDAGKSSLMSAKSAVAVAYYSLTADAKKLSADIRPAMLKAVSSLTEGCDYAPVVFSLTKEKEKIKASVEIHVLSMQKTKAPTHERDTVVLIPSGPFEVRNSHTGKKNTFYQNAQKAICLRDETGKDLWGVPLGKSICGTAHNVDYYANGKLQIIFGAGSSIYVIDRLGRYVSGFPIDLRKEITLGPDVYDFSGARKYNIMVLHKDNTIQMYNLKGKQPEAWKGITAEETIKALPELIRVGNKDFWIVRTSIQTLIFPFYGGEPLTVFEGNSKIKPDSEVKVVDETSVQMTSYDGKSRDIRLIK